jgi:natural product precursor
MNEAKKLTLSKETLRCLDDQELTGVVGGWGGGGGGNSNTCNNSNVCQSNALACISNDCLYSVLGCNGSGVICL